MSRLILTAVGGAVDNTVAVDLGPEGSPGVDDVVVAVEAAPINNADLLFAAGWFAARRTEDLDTPSGPDVAAAQMAAFREWEQSRGTRFGDLERISQPTLVVNGIHDEMVPVSNSYRLAENLPNAVLLAYPDSGHGSLFQFHDSFVRHAAAFLVSDAPFAPY